MLIRQFEDGDESRIAEIHNLAFKDWIESLGTKYYYEYITYQEVLGWLSKNTSIWVAEDSGSLVGYIHCTLEIEGKIPILYFTQTHWDMGQSKLAVYPKYQRKNVGSSLINTTIDYYKTLEAKVAIAFTYSDNLPMESLLTKLGFIHPGIFYYSPYSEVDPLGHDSVYACRDMTIPVPEMPLNPDVLVRPAEDRDIDDLIVLFQKSAFWIEKEVTKKWISGYFALIRNESGRILIAEINNKTVGAMDYMKSRGRIGIPGVLPEYRRQGIGHTLFYRLLKSMQNDGVRDAIADTGIILSDAIKMYEKFGFDFPRKQHVWFKVL